MKKIAVFILLLLCLGSVLMAETMELTLDEAIQLGLANSTAIRTRMLAVASARADMGVARSVYYPSVSASISYGHLDEPNMFSGQDPAALDLDVRQSISTFGKTAAGINLAAESLTQAELDLAEEQRSLTVLIETAFYTYLLALELDAINSETLANKQDALAVARQRFRAGLISDFEVLEQVSLELNHEFDRPSAREATLDSGELNRGSVCSLPTTCITNHRIAIVSRKLPVFYTSRITTMLICWINKRMFWHSE